MLRACEIASAKFAEDLKEAKILSGKQAEDKLNQSLSTLKLSLFKNENENALRDLKSYLNFLLF